MKVVSWALNITSSLLSLVRDQSGVGHVLQEISPLLHQDELGRVQVQKKKNALGDEKKVEAVFNIFNLRIRDIYL